MSLRCHPWCSCENRFHATRVNTSDRGGVNNSSSLPGTRLLHISDGKQFKKPGCRTSVSIMPKTLKKKKALSSKAWSFLQRSTASTLTWWNVKPARSSPVYSRHHPFLLRRCEGPPSLSYELPSSIYFSQHSQSAQAKASQSWSSCQRKYFVSKVAKVKG